MSQTLAIIIPTYRRKDSLTLLLNALLAQQGITPEIIVVDQNAPGFLDSSIPAAPNIKRVMLERPNVSDARNKGFQHSSGDILLFIDDDLVPENDFCAKGVGAFETYPSIGCFAPLVYNADGRELALQQARAKQVGTFPGNEEIFSMTDTISAALFFRRAYYRLTGGFDPMLFDFAKTAEDQEFFLRMRRKQLLLYFIPFIEVYHDETIPGGCDLRTVEYWITREKCMKAWAYRYRIHHAPPGKLSFGDMLRLSRSGFLNREGLSSGIGKLFRQIRLLKNAIHSSDSYLKERLARYLPVEKMDHLQ